MKNVLLATLVACCIGVLPASGETLKLARPESVGMSSERLQRVRTHFEQMVERREAAGFQIVIARRGKVVMQESIGELKVDGGVPVTNDTLFRIYSMTKPITAVAMMMLYEEGLYSLADPISKYIPQFANLKVFAGLNEAGEMILVDPVRPPQMQDLFLHTAGFTYGAFGDTPVDRLYRAADVLDRNAPLSEMIDKLSTIPLLHQPGEQYVYGVAADIEGYLIEKLSGMDLETFLRTRIFDPLRMNETMSWVPASKAALLAEVHVHDEQGKLTLFSADPDPTRYAFEKSSRFSGGGQLISTADDYFRFAQMMLNGGVLDGVCLLSPQTLKLMTADRYTAMVPNRIVEAGRGYGFHLTVVTEPNLMTWPTSAGEYGHGGLATTHFTVDPELELVVILLNQYFPTDNDNMRDIIHRLVHAAIID